MVVRLMEILSTIGALNHESQGGMVSQLIGQPTTPEKNILMPVKPLVLRIAGSKIIALVMKVQFQL